MDTQVCNLTIESCKYAKIKGNIALLYEEKLSREKVLREKRIAKFKKFTFANDIVKGISRG